ncbi:MAG: hypothetical protein HFG75_10365 [Hungatella sp.]|nr:hypothetical protein [Hungatella sp.]
MLMTELLRSIGIPVVTRNLMVDYRDGRGNHFHKPMQAVTPPGQEMDVDMLTQIGRDLKSQGYALYSILEAFGEFELEELEDVFNGSRQGECPVAFLYLDKELLNQIMSRAEDMPGKR